MNNFDLPVKEARLSILINVKFCNSIFFLLPLRGTISRPLPLVGWDFHLISLIIIFILISQVLSLFPTPILMWVRWIKVSILSEFSVLIFLTFIIILTMLLLTKGFESLTLVTFLTFSDRAIVKRSLPIFLWFILKYLLFLYYIPFLTIGIFHVYQIIVHLSRFFLYI
jgi:hypothetical protein